MQSKTPDPFEFSVRTKVLGRIPSQAERDAEIAASPNGEFFTHWLDAKVDAKAIKQFPKVVESADDERPIQQFLQKNPSLLIRHLGGGHGRWVIPQKRLGSEFVSDFIIGDAHSLGHEWFLVELESPRAKAFNRSGDPSKQLAHAIRQIEDWRVWLTKNLDYAGRKRTESGLGLAEIHPDLAGYIIIGRRDEGEEKNRSRLRQYMRKHNVEIHSYDWLMDSAGGRVDWFGTALAQEERRLAQKGKTRRGMRSPPRDSKGSGVFE